MTHQQIIFVIFTFASVCLPISAAEHKIISTSELEWGPLNPARGDASPQAANLWGDRIMNTATGMLVRFNKGFSSPPHIHNISYRGIVIEGLMHNDDPSAEKMWLRPGSFWTQPAGENHITAANGESNLIYLEIDAGPYLVQHSNQAFDNGERPINIETDNIVWLSSDDVTWVSESSVQIAYLWRNVENNNGTFIKISRGFEGNIEGSSDLKAIIIKGEASHAWNKANSFTDISPGSFFSSVHKGKHYIKTHSEVVLYIRSNGKFHVK